MGCVGRKSCSQWPAWKKVMPHAVAEEGMRGSSRSCIWKLSIWVFDWTGRRQVGADCSCQGDEAGWGKSLEWHREKMYCVGTNEKMQPQGKCFSWRRGLLLLLRWGALHSPYWGATEVCRSHCAAVVVILHAQS